MGHVGINHSVRVFELWQGKHLGERIGCHGEIGLWWYS